ncbi:relaxase/mobilization nuclease domain-containing protein [Duganella sp. BuS-21]|uniref:relaxase/mobilization nuclease domain-containing protein n=1 Tax=Duganella sp. BuS-21 TaxID=2943848 RepID=UPI0035A6815C
MKPSQVDAYLKQWDADGFNQRQIRRVYGKSTGALKLYARPRSADAVRSRLQGIVRRSPQAMVRISGGGRGMGRIRAHLAYISRHGRLEIEDQDGERYHGKEDLAWLGYAWQCGGMPIAEDSWRREALNIVLSMPAGTDSQSLRRAVRAFAQDEFSGHQYAMALHSYDSDPGKDPSPHPHVHLCVKMAGADGRRLNPRKQDFRRWRERFAERLREHGIDAAATSRLERFQPRRGRKQSVRHMLERGAALRQVVDQGERQQRRERAQRREQEMLLRYGKVAEVLALSDEPSDRSLAVGIAGLAERWRDRDVVRAPER